MKVNVEALFPQNASVNKISDDYLKGTFTNTEARNRLSKILDLRGKAQTVTMQLVEQTDGRNYYMQLPGMTLPGTHPELRHELFLDDRNSKWFTYDTPMEQVGHIDAGWTNSLSWHTDICTLFGYVPVGERFSKPGLAPNECAYFEVPYQKLGAAATAREGESQRYFVVSYTDSRQRSIREISCFWNLKAKTPFTITTFQNSVVQAGRHSFSRAQQERFEGGKLCSISQFDFLGTEQTDLPIDAKPPTGHLFVDRQSLDGQQFTFRFDGKGFPAAAELLADYKRTGPPEKHRLPFAGFFAGVGCVLGGFALWSRAKRINA